MLRSATSLASFSFSDGSLETTGRHISCCFWKCWKNNLSGAFSPKSDLHFLQQIQRESSAGLREQGIRPGSETVKDFRPPHHRPGNPRAVQIAEFLEFLAMLLHGHVARIHATRQLADGQSARELQLLKHRPPLRLDQILEYGKKHRQVTLISADSADPAIHKF